MRKLILSFVLATAGAVGLTATQPARAYDDGRIFVSIGDVSFAYGRPYHRHSNAPLYVVQESWGPRYYYHGPAYRPPVYVPRYYAPPRYYPPRYAYGYRDDHRHHGRHDRYDHHDDHRGRGHDDNRWRDDGRGRRDHDRRRDH